MSDDLARLRTYDRLPAVRFARQVLRETHGLELTVVGRAGPLPHQDGGVMSASSEPCRVSLFQRDGFARCDAFYRELAAEPEEAVRTCHLGLHALSVPVTCDGEALASLIVSGMSVRGAPGQVPVDETQVAGVLRELDPALPDPGRAARDLPSLSGEGLATVRAILRTAASAIASHEQSERAKAQGDGDGELPGMWGLVGAAPRMKRLFELLSRVADSDATVLVLGESGTGKELVARAVHAHGRRSSGPFVAQNCAALPSELLETTLFGHVRGAFSGADRDHPGLLGAADGGVLLLDEVGDMPLALQVKLLRVLQDGTYTPVGGTTTRTADVRIVAATHRDLAAMVEQGEFRSDLFYRLHVLPLRVPPLRERTEDVPLLVRRFMRELDDAPARASQEAMRCLERYRWPGNVRELRAEVERWEISASGAPEVGPEHLSTEVRAAGGYTGDDEGRAAAAAAAGQGSLAAAVEALERALLRRGLERTDGNRSRLARELDISRTTLGARLKRYGMDG